MLVFIGGNAWAQRHVDDDIRSGNWSQTVYQVDDAPRYGAIATWNHENGVSEWVPPYLRVLVREIGMNTYVRSDAFPAEVGDDYWEKTSACWAGVRGIRSGMEATGAPFALTQKGEADRLYMALLGLAVDVATKARPPHTAIEEARIVIARETTTALQTLAARLRGSTDDADY